MIKKTIWVGLTLSLLGFLSAPAVRADDRDKKTVLTFSQRFEIPGHVLPAGTYTFKLADLLGDRHIVQVYNADGSRLIATVMTIPNYRLKTTTETVIRFREVPRGSPEAIRAWFYPGNSVGQEFVYPRQRATELARIERVAVPAVAVDAADVATLKTAPIVAITPDEKEVPVTAAIQTTPTAPVASVANVTAPRDSSPVVGTTGVEQTAQNARTTLPQTASMLPLIALLGLGSIAASLGLMVFWKHASASAG